MDIGEVQRTLLIEPLIQPIPTIIPIAGLADADEAPSLLPAPANP